jgi:type I restriction enzyme S subunit
MSWKKVKLKEVLKQYRVQHIVQDEIEYKQVTISKYDGVTFRGTKIGKEIGRKRQFVIDLKTYPNTLMLVRQGIQDGSIGIAPIEVDGCIATENMPMFSIEGVDLEYLRFLLKSPYFYDELNKIETTGSAQKSIHERQILEIEIPLPDIKEQKEFVTELTKLKNSGSGFSNELTHQLDIIKQLRQAFLREAMQGKLVKSTNTKKTGKELLAKIKAEKAQLIADKKLKKEKPLLPITDEEIPFEIPEHWAWSRFNSICETRLGKMLDSVKNKGKLHPYFRNINVQWYQIRLDDVLSMKFEEKELEEYSIKKGDLLICEGGYPGRAAIWESDDETFKFQKALHRVRFYENIPAKFYLYYLDLLCSSGKIKDYFTGSGIQHLTGKSLKEMPIPLPPLHEQEQIVAKLEELMAFCDGLEQSIKESQGYNEMLLQQVLREALQPSEKV